MAIYIGDGHGNFQHLKQEFRKNKKTNYIHVGDYGLTQTNETLVRRILEEQNKILKRNNSFLYVNRGNHDNPMYWQNSSSFSLSNLRLMQDYDLANIEGKMTLFLGGAISIDRTRLVQDKYSKKWWPDEVFVYDENIIQLILESANQIDVVISHSAPNFAYPMGFNQLVMDWAKEDPDLLKDLALERENLARVYQFLSTKFKIKRWVYGHFHFPNTMHYNGTEFTIQAQNTFSINQY